MSTYLTFTPFLGTPFPSKPHKWKTRLDPNPKVSSILNQTPLEDDPKTIKKDQRFNLFHLSVTLTVISTSLSVSQPVMAATNVKKKRAGNKPKQVLTSEQLKKWSEGLPIVKNRIPFSEILSLRELGKVKHVVKPTSAVLRLKPEWVLVVLDDGRVLRSVLPSYEVNPRFWERWDVLGMDVFCINAFSPPVRTPEVPRPYLGFVSRLPKVVYGMLFKPKVRSKKAMELRRMREELRRAREEELRRDREEREMMERVAKQQKRAEERERRREERRIEHEENMQEAVDSSLYLSGFWTSLARDPNVANGLGCLFFYIFYRTVVLNYKKQKKDYEDRLKIEKAEAEERRKMRELERQMQGYVGIDEEEDEGKSGGGEEDPHMKMAMQFMKSGARVSRARNKRLPQFLDKDVDVKFSDVAGLGKIRVELEEIVKFFTHGEVYRRRGVKMPGGILLCGPPGVGKTLLAKAVAGEAGVNFFSISASQFVEIYVGVGASRVKALYQEARENAPAVVFIDELDAVGRERGLIKGSGGQERDATLNQLLVCLDGFEGRGDVITIASTNRPDILDPALVRPGRFDRKIYIPKPSFQGRIEILQVHARNKRMAEDVDYMAVAGVTDGMVGAELANVIEVAAINMLRDGRSEITTDDLLQAAQMEERGMLMRKERSPELLSRIALNEASQAIMAVNFPDFRNIEFINIAPRAGRELGYVRFNTDHVKFEAGMMSRQSVLDHITIQLAQRAADEIWYGEDQLSTIWAETADSARSAARTLVLGGLWEKHHGLNNFWTADKINDIDLEALQILHMCYERAKKILQRNRELVNAVVNELIQNKTMTKKEFFYLVEMHGSLEPAPLSVLEIRAKKVAEFQEKLKGQEKTAVGSSV